LRFDQDVIRGGYLYSPITCVEIPAKKHAGMTKERHAGMTVILPPGPEPGSPEKVDSAEK